MRESTIERHLVEQIEAIGGTAEKFVSPRRRNVPDRLVLIPGLRRTIYEAAVGRRPGAALVRPPLVLFVEVKAPGKKPTPGQARDHARRRAMGFRVEVVDSLEAVYTLVESLR